jgi:hypothetical protein
MRRLRFLISLLVSVLIVGAVAGLTAGANLSAIAQEGTLAVLASHPVVGAWRVDTDADDPANQPSYAIFHADGSYLEFHPTVGTGIGVWASTGERTADLTVIFADLDPTEPGFTQAATTIRAAVAVDESGNALTAPYTFHVGPEGAVVYEGMLTATGTRIEVEPMTLLGTPVAGTPAP